MLGPILISGSELRKFLFAVVGLRNLCVSLCSAGSGLVVLDPSHRKCHKRIANHVLTTYLRGFISCYNVNRFFYVGSATLCRYETPRVCISMFHLELIHRYVGVVEPKHLTTASG